MPARALDRHTSRRRGNETAPTGDIVALAGWTTDHRRMALKLDRPTGRLVIVTLEWAADQFRQDREPRVPGPISLLKH